MPAELERIINQSLEKDRNLRYQHAADMRAEMQRLKRDSDSGHVAGASSAKVEAAEGPFSHTSSPASAPITASSSARVSTGAAEPPVSASGTAAAVAPPKMWWKVAVPVAVLMAVLIAGGLYFRSVHAAKLTEKDTVVLAEFANTTGDPVFDGTLKQALAVDLDQSPFLQRGAPGAHPEDAHVHGPVSRRAPHHGPGSGFVPARRQQSDAFRIDRQLGHRSTC